MGRFMKDMGDFAGGIVAGLTVGFVAALILAPREGEETRARLADGAEDALSRPREIADELQARVARALEEGRQAAAEARAELEASAGIRQG